MAPRKGFCNALKQCAWNIAGEIIKLVEAEEIPSFWWYGIAWLCANVVFSQYKTRWLLVILTSITYVAKRSWNYDDHWSGIAERNAIGDVTTAFSFVSVQARPIEVEWTSRWWKEWRAYASLEAAPQRCLDLAHHQLQRLRSHIQLMK